MYSLPPQKTQAQLKTEMKWYDRDYCMMCDCNVNNMDNDNRCKKHIHSKKHQKNKLKISNKTHNVLLALVRNDVNNDLIGEINKRVILNYLNDRDIKNHSNNIYIMEQKDLKKELCDKYYHTTNTEHQYIGNELIGMRTLNQNSNYKLIDNIPQDLNRDVVISSFWSPHEDYGWSDELDIIREQIHSIMECKKFAIHKIVDDMKRFYIKKDSLDLNYTTKKMDTLLNYQEKLEDFIDNQPISLVFQ
jgi:hypothetical protein